jgi:branched-chain amino acid transport system permease protein
VTIDFRGSHALERARFRWGEAAPLLVGVACFFLFPNYLVFGASVLTMALFTVSLDLIIGFAGVLTLGHGIFYGLGAYAAGLFALHGLNEPISDAVLSALLAAVVAAIVGPFVLRLRGLRLIMVTLALASIALEVANKADALTGGHDGLQGLEIAPIFGRFEWALDGSASYLYALGWLILCLVAARTIVASPFGLALQGIRENETRMRVLGSPVQMQLAIAYVISAFVAGLAGAIATETNAFVSLDVLSLDVSIYALAMLVLGGICRVYGAVLGTVVYMGVQYFTQELNASYWMFAIGLLLIVVVRFARGGLLGAASAAWLRLAGGATPA